MKRLLWLPLIVTMLAASPKAQIVGADRAFEPVVLTGADLTGLEGALPQQLAAFRYEDGVWTLIPSQVDEREFMDLAWVYDGRNGIRCDTTSAADPHCFGQSNYGFVFGTIYTNTGTFVGDDTDPLLDDDDEFVFMAKDAGYRAPLDAPAPPGVFGPSGTEIQIARPWSDGSRPLPAYIYLFHHDGSYAPDTSYVDYTYNLLSGDYLSTYIQGGTRGGSGIPSDSTGYMLASNPEDSDVHTPYYRRHFSDRWIEDGLELALGSGVDIVDRFKYQPRLGHCFRTEWTASGARGAMIANRNGPVRGVRSVMGFNSGPFRQRDYHFYEQYSTTTNYFRVHSINGFLEYVDLSEEALGMTYTSNLQPVPYVVDGMQDPGVDEAGPYEWTMLQGVPGTLVTSYFHETTIPDSLTFTLTSYYQDEAPTPIQPCTADGNAYGASGFRTINTIPNTDPSLGEYEHLTFGWHFLHDGPDLTSEEALAFVTATNDPIHWRTRVLTVDAPPPAQAAPPVSARTEEFGPRLHLNVPRPNPAAGLTTLVYEVPAEGNVLLTLYDLQGRRVAVLAEGMRAAGRYRALLNTEHLAAGMYLVQLVTDAGSRTVRLVRP